MDIFLQTVVSAIAAGAVYGLLGAGFSLSYKTTGIINFAHGDLAILGAYVAYAAVSSGAPVALAALAGVVAAAGAGGVIERGILRPLYRRPAVTGILVTVGVSVILQSMMHLVWGSRPLTLPSLASAVPWHFGPLSFSPAQLLLFLVAVGVSLVTVISIDRTRVGRAMRGCAQDHEATSLLGVSPARMYSLAFILAGGLAGLSGVLIAPSLGLIPSRGLSLSVIGFAAAVLGGLGSLPGAVAGGILIAVLQNLAAVYVNATYSNAVTYLAIVLVLLVRVRGLFGDEVASQRTV